MAKSDLDRAPIFMVRTRQGTLAPASSFDAERLDAIAIGAQVEVTIKQRRSSPQNRLYWSILSKVVENIEGYPTSDTLHDALKLHLGYTETFKTITGKVEWRPISTAFAKMDAQEYRVFFDRAMDVLASMLGVDPLSLLDEGREQVA